MQLDKVEETTSNPNERRRGARSLPSSAVFDLEAQKYLFEQVRPKRVQCEALEMNPYLWSPLIYNVFNGPGGPLCKLRGF